MKNKVNARRAISLTALSIATLAAGAFAPPERAFAQEALPEIDIGVGRAPAQASDPAPATGLPISSPDAVGSKAPPGSAPALAPSQAPLDSFEPTSIVSDKILRDVVIPSGDYNDAVKYTPGFYSSNPNGPLGDTKGGWRGFQDGQYNITFDGIPFGDENDPTHHSAAYFPAAFLGQGDSRPRSGRRLAGRLCDLRRHASDAILRIAGHVRRQRPIFLWRLQHA